mmetsp:Transcript_22300/g.32460  ORF Transcript_22300/g.32460 Transcript_22300/m.32460 type:complete len:256 (-) Transcript_22300:274-1041(-)
MEQKGPSTKERLKSIVNDFDSFDSEMKIGTRQRREKDEFRIAELKMEMKRLDNELTAEIKKRTEMNKSTQAWFEGELLALNTKFRDVLQEKSEASMDKLEILDMRITKLGEHFDREKTAILNQIEERGRELADMLNKFKDEFDHDRELRLARDAQMVKQLTDHEHIVGEKFEKQIQAREARYSALRIMLEDNIKLRDKAEERFQSFFEREVHRLHNDVREESEVREREDDEIVEALNRYTIKLQTSLKLLNSTET